MAPYLVLGAIASALLALGLLMMKSRAAVLPAASGWHAPAAIFAWIRDPVWLGGLGLQTAGYALYLTALTRAPVSLLAVTMQGGIALFALFAVIFLGERASNVEWLGLAGVLAAMLMLALSLGGGEESSTIEVATLVLFSLAAAAAAALPMASQRMRRTGTGIAIASGIIFGMGSLYGKALTGILNADSTAPLAMRIAASPWVYLTIAANVSGLVMLQNAFTRARGLIAMPLSSALSNLVPIAGGMLAFGERLPAAPLPAALRIGAFALTIAAGTLLSTASVTEGRTANDL
jgi:hypothetical protein